MCLFKNTASALVAMAAAAFTGLAPVSSAAQDKPIVLMPMKKKMPYYAFKVIPADMTGWTAITKGAAKGGASLVMGKGRTIIVTRGGDDGLYAAPFNPAAPALIHEDAWIYMSTANSEPHCASVESAYHYGAVIILCAVLGPQGNAKMVIFRDNGKDLLPQRDDEMGGRNAGAAPTFLRPPQLDSTGKQLTYKLAVWDGAKATFFRIDGIDGSFSTLNKPAGITPWTKQETGWASPPGCGVDKLSLPGECVTAGRPPAEAVVVVQNYKNPSDPIGSSWISPVLADGIEGKPATTRLASGRSVMAVRGKSGKLHQVLFTYSTGKFGTWRNEGGYVASGTTPACTSYAEKPVCVIQGADGRLYAKALTTASGL